MKLYKAARKFITDTETSVDIKKWAAEGLAFLSLDADVKAGCYRVMIGCSFTLYNL